MSTAYAPLSYGPGAGSGSPEASSSGSGGAGGHSPTSSRGGGGGGGGIPDGFDDGTGRFLFDGEVEFDAGGPGSSPRASGSFEEAKTSFAHAVGYGPPAIGVKTEDEAKTVSVLSPEMELVRWEEESCNVVQITIEGEVIARRVDNSYVNGTKMLNLVGLTRGRRDSALKNIRERVVVLKGPRNLKGVWVPLEHALALCERFKLHHRVGHLLEPSLCSSILLQARLNPALLPPVRPARHANLANNVASAKRRALLQQAAQQASLETREMHHQAAREAAIVAHASISDSRPGPAQASSSTSRPHAASVGSEAGPSGGGGGGGGGTSGSDASSNGTASPLVNNFRGMHFASPPPPSMPIHPFLPPHLMMGMPALPFVSFPGFGPAYPAAAPFPYPIPPQQAGTPRYQQNRPSPIRVASSPAALPVLSSFGVGPSPLSAPPDTLDFATSSAAGRPISPRVEAGGASSTASASLSPQISPLFEPLRPAPAAATETAPHQHFNGGGVASPDTTLSAHSSHSGASPHCGPGGNGTGRGGNGTSAPPSTLPTPSIPQFADAGSGVWSVPAAGSQTFSPSIGVGSPFGLESPDAGLSLDAGSSTAGGGDDDVGSLVGGSPHANTWPEVHHHVPTSAIGGWPGLISLPARPPPSEMWKPGLMSAPAIPVNPPMASYFGFVPPQPIDANGLPYSLHNFSSLAGMHPGFAAAASTTTTTAMSSFATNPPLSAPAFPPANSGSAGGDVGGWPFPGGFGGPPTSSAAAWPFVGASVSAPGGTKLELSNSCDGWLASTPRDDEKMD